MLRACSVQCRASCPGRRNCLDILEPVRPWPLTEANVVAVMLGPHSFIPGAGMTRVDHKSSVQPDERIRAHHGGGSVRDTMNLKAFLNKVLGLPGGELSSSLRRPAADPTPPHEPRCVAILRCIPARERPVVDDSPHDDGPLTLDMDALPIVWVRPSGSALWPVS